MYETLFICIAVALGVLNLAILIMVGRRLVALDRRVRQLASAQQRHERDLTQQRYALAMLRQLYKGGEGSEPEDEKSDEQLLDSALNQLVAIDKTGAAAAPPPTPSAQVGDLKDKEILQLIKHAIQSNKLAISVQPIVTLPGQDVHYYEVFSRIDLGEQGYIPASKFISVARDNNLIGALDNLLLLRCLQKIKQTARRDPAAGFFVNISSQTLNSKSYINDLVEFLQANPKLSSRLVFEVTQQESLKVSPMTKAVMENLALLGCRFSMDQVKILGLDVDRLEDHNISFVKIEVKALEKELKDNAARKRIKKIKAMLEAQGVQVIAEKIETDKQLFNIMDLCVDYGQGYLFGQPQVLA